jgi:catechol 2,3-dioxygenase-like lactoylglutathione lyase family enzyme
LTYVSHLGLTVSDLKRSLTFYQDVVGLSYDDHREALGINRAGDTGGQRTLPSGRGDLIATKSDAFDELTNNSGAELLVAFLRSRDFCLQLIQYVAGGGDVLDLHHNNVGSPHLSIGVEDVDAKFAQVQGRGDVKITSGLVQIVPTGRSFYVEDPDGLPVEFIQWSNGGEQSPPPS